MPRPSGWLCEYDDTRQSHVALSSLIPSWTSSTISLQLCKNSCPGLKLNLWTGNSMFSCSHGLLRSLNPIFCELSIYFDADERQLIVLISCRVRQYPLYSKKAPPPALEKAFEPGQFEKSQAYGKDKAKFALFSGLYKQCLDSALLQYGFYAWSWKAAGCVIAKLGYDSAHEVSIGASKRRV